MKSVDMIPNGEKHASVESTQLLLKERLQGDPVLPHLFSIRADIQTGGRGRGGNVWVSEKGNLHASILIRELPFNELTWIPLWVSFCVLKALEGSGLEHGKLQLKWPNDLWMEQSKKVGGILCEKVGPVVIAGVGLNLDHAPQTSQETGAISTILPGLEPQTVLERILAQMLKPVPISSLKEAYERNALFQKGQSIEWKTDQGSVSYGEVVSLGVHGELLVKMADGGIVPLFSEDIRASRRVNAFPL